MKAARNVDARMISVQMTTVIGSASNSLHSKSNGLIIRVRKFHIFITNSQNFLFFKALFNKILFNLSDPTRSNDG